MATWAYRPWLTDLLVCPACGERLFFRPDRLTCVAGHGFPIIDGIPRFTPPSSYADSFGFEWTRFPRLQLDDEVRSESERTFRQKTGLTPEDVRGKSVLDAGCGMGRFSHVVAGWGAERIVGVDISHAVDAAAGNLESFASVALGQADIRQLPFPSATFDIVFSIGVLHHTPSTRGSFAHIARLVKPGGILAVWVYSRRLRGLLGGELLRLVTRRMDPATLLRCVRWTVPRLAAIKRRFPLLAAPADLVVPTSNHPISEWRVLDTFDWYSPRYQWKHTYAEVEAWFLRLGFTGIERLSVPVSVRGRRPH